MVLSEKIQGGHRKGEAWDLDVTVLPSEKEKMREACQGFKLGVKRDTEVERAFE